MLSQSGFSLTSLLSRTYSGFFTFLHLHDIAASCISALCFSYSMEKKIVSQNSNLLEVWYMSCNTVSSVGSIIIIIAHHDISG